MTTIDNIVDSLDDSVKDYLENDVLRNDAAEELAKLLSRDKSEVLKALAKDASDAKIDQLDFYQANKFYKK